MLPSLLREERGGVGTRLLPDTSCSGFTRTSTRLDACSSFHRHFGGTPCIPCGIPPAQSPPPGPTPGAGDHCKVASALRY